MTDLRAPALTYQHVLDADPREISSQYVAILKSLPDIGGVEIEREIITFTFLQPEASNPGLMRELLARGVPLVTLQQESRNLEDIFLNVTKGVIA